MQYFSAQALDNWPKLGNLRVLLPAEAQAVESIHIQPGTNLYLVVGNGKITMVFKRFSVGVFWTDVEGCRKILNKTFPAGLMPPVGAPTREEAVTHLESFTASEGAQV